jgi:hypothetical protein
MSEDASMAEVRQQIAASHEEIRALHAYWEGKRGSRAMPRRADIDPVEIKRFLPQILLVDVTADARRFVYRLVGTAEVAERGGDPTGKSVREAHFGGTAEEAIACYERVVRSRAPFCYRDPYTAPDGRRETEDIIYLPLSEDGETVSVIMVFSHSYTFKRRRDEGSMI